MRDTQRFGVVITRSGPGDRLPEMPWLERDYRVDESDLLVLSDEGWRAVVEGDPAIWEALERKLFIGFYVSQPDLVAVVGRSSGHGAQSDENGRDEVRRVVRRIRSLLLPTAVLGFWTDADGRLDDAIQPGAPARGAAREELAAAGEPTA